MLLRTSAALEDVREHLKVSNLLGSPVEAYLTQYLLVVFSAEMQEEIMRSLTLRAYQCGDPDIANFVTKAGDRLLRSVLKDEIVGFVSLFDPGVKGRIANSLSERDTNAYNLVIKARHKVAHGAGAQITFGELLAAVDVGRILLRRIRAWMPGN